MNTDKYGIKEITVWKTPDGDKHDTHEMAVQHVFNNDLRSALDERSLSDGQDILNFLSGRRCQVRAWLDACDAMEKAALR